MARVTTRRFGNGPRDGREDNYRDDLYRDGQGGHGGHGGHERADYDDAGYDDAGYDDADYVEYEVVDDDAAAAGEEYHGSHRRADAEYAAADYADADYTDAGYADASYEHAGYPERAARTERAGGAGVAEGGSTAVAAGGVPKRGLAMILIAVAALLLLWGIYAMTQRDTSSDTSAESSASQSVAAPGQDAQGQNSQGQNSQGQSAAPSAKQASPASPSAANPANPSAANPSAANPSAGQDAGRQNPPAAQPNAEGGQGLQASDAEVLVYNNSGVPNAAQETADKLHNQYRVANDSHDVTAMNMPEQNYGVFPETYVFYNPQVAGADKVAADVARQIGGTPRSTKDLPGAGLSLPAQANNPSAITVVIAG